MPTRKLNESEQAFVSVALRIAATQYTNDAKNMGAQAGTLEAPLSSTYARMAAEFLVQVETAKTLSDLVSNAASITVEIGAEKPAKDPDGL
jgi:hypothetical protein